MAVSKHATKSLFSNLVHKVSGNSLISVLSFRIQRGTESTCGMLSRKGRAKLPARALHIGLGGMSVSFILNAFYDVVKLGDSNFAS